MSEFPPTPTSHTLDVMDVPDGCRRARRRHSTTTTAAAAAMLTQQFATITPRFTAARTPTAASPKRASLTVTAAAQTLEGRVVSVAGAKSKTLLVERKVPHPKYVKRVNKSAKFMFHDEDDSCKVGDRVEIVACRPMSAKKRFEFRRVCASSGSCAAE